VRADIIERVEVSCRVDQRDQSIADFHEH
jgi:hypothetical protein